MRAQKSRPKKHGSLEVITGPMFSGKSEELVRRLRRAAIANHKIQLFSHALDARYGDKKVMTHSGHSLASESVIGGQEILRLVRRDTHLVAIDEAQFFGNSLVGVVRELLRRGHHVIIAGLSVTMRGDAFDPMPQFMAEAEKVLKLTAICTKCGGDAPFHERTSDTPKKLKKYDPALVGGTEAYIAVCRSCRKKTGTANV